MINQVVEDMQLDIFDDDYFLSLLEVDELTLVRDWDEIE